MIIYRADKFSVSIFDENTFEKVGQYNYTTSNKNIIGINNLCIFDNIIIITIDLYDEEDDDISIATYDVVFYDYLKNEVVDICTNISFLGLHIYDVILTNNNYLIFKSLKFLFIKKLNYSQDGNYSFKHVSLYETGDCSISFTHDNYILICSTQFIKKVNIFINEEILIYDRFIPNSISNSISNLISFSYNVSSTKFKVDIIDYNVDTQDCNLISTIEPSFYSYNVFIKFSKLNRNIVAIASHDNLEIYDINSSLCVFEIKDILLRKIEGIDFIVNSSQNELLICLLSDNTIKVYQCNECNEWREIFTIEDNIKSWGKYLACSSYKPTILW